jgi:hypothetical protein
MAKDLTVSLENRPGTLADLGEALGKAGVNIEGTAGFTVGDQGAAHILVEDAEKARQALEGTGTSAEAESDVLVIDIEDRPGALGEIARKIADAGVNITFGYLATNNRLVLGADDLDKAKAAL